MREKDGHEKRTSWSEKVIQAKEKDIHQTKREPHPTHREEVVLKYLWEKGTKEKEQKGFVATRGEVPHPEADFVVGLDAVLVHRLDDEFIVFARLGAELDGRERARVEDVHAIYVHTADRVVDERPDFVDEHALLALDNDVGVCDRRLWPQCHLARRRCPSITAGSTIAAAGSNLVVEASRAEHDVNLLFPRHDLQDVCTSQAWGCPRECGSSLTELEQGAKAGTRCE
jgi:hypothetical protein